MILGTFTTNGDGSTFDHLVGEFALGMLASDGSAADFGGGTLQFVFLSPDGDEYPLSTEWAFTEAPGFPEGFIFPAYTKVLLRLTGATAPDLVVRAHRVR